MAEVSLIPDGAYLTIEDSAEVVSPVPGVGFVEENGTQLAPYGVFYYVVP